MPLLQRRFPLIHRFIAFVALLGMLVPIGTMLVHEPAAAQSWVHICGADATNQNDSHSDQHKAPPHKTPLCPICQSLHFASGAFIPADAPQPFLALNSVVLPSTPARAFILTAFPVFQGRPRAPPALS